MQLKRAELQLATEDDGTIQAAPGRTAALITLAGCGVTILAVLLPWMEKAGLGITLTAIGPQQPAVLLGVLALVAGAVAFVVLLRHPVAATVPIILIVLAVMQLPLAVWDSANIVRAIQVGHHPLLIGAVGTGLYGTVLGPIASLTGGILAWSSRVPG